MHRITARSAAAVVSLLIAGGAFAAKPPALNKGDLTNVACSFGDVANAAVSACSGFYSGNLLNTDAPNATDADETVGLNDLLGTSSPSFAVLQKIDNTNGLPADFTQLLYGDTIIGIHFGDGAPLFKEAQYHPEFNGVGGGTAFYRFDAGQTGLDTVVFADYLAQASSGATLYRTGDAPITSPIPEPETYALMLAGLGMLGFMARRRRED